MSYMTAARAERPATSRSFIFAAVAALAGLVTAASTARAQDAATPSPRAFTGIVGVGAAAMPKYEGSDEYRAIPLPIIQVEYKGRLYLGGSQSSMAPGLGAHVVRTSAMTWDVGLTGEAPRAESYGDALAGMGKRSAAAFGSTGISYRLGMVMASAGAAVGLGTDQGAYGTIGLGTELPLSRRLVAGISTGASFANAENMAFEFGVTPEQSEVRRALQESGDPRLSGIDVATYAPSAGLKDVNASASLAWLLTPRSRVVLFAQGTRLSDEASRSPLVQSRNGTIAGLAIGYGF